MRTATPVHRCCPSSERSRALRPAITAPGRDRLPVRRRLFRLCFNLPPEHDLGKAFQVGYPLGFLIAPILLYEHWQDQYRELLELLQKRLASKGKGISFELITHRFTERAKKIIEEIYPRTELPMNKETRQFKYGQFGYGKYVYPAATRTELENYLRKMINAVFPEGEIKYFV